MNDGSTKERAAISAMDIKRLICTNRNGLYWILPADGNKNNASLIYCIMDKLIFGGGWMLALKGKKNSAEFIFNSRHWTTNTVLNNNPYNKSDYELYETDAKYSIYNYYGAVDCLAMFDKNDTNDELTYVNNPEYGWVWNMNSFFGGSRISLLDYFTPRTRLPYGYSTYIYTSKNNRDNSTWVQRWMRDVGLGGTYMQPQYFEQSIVNVTCKLRAPLNRRIFSQQEAFKAWGLNVIPHGWNHAVRWGGTFNENEGPWDGIPNTNDVSCGIGLQARNYSAGDAIGCCQSTAGTNASMGFKWFIR